MEQKPLQSRERSSQSCCPPSLVLTRSCLPGVTHSGKRPKRGTRAVWGEPGPWGLASVRAAA